jgi:hypothetical protein
MLSAQSKRDLATALEKEVYLTPDGFGKHVTGRDSPIYRQLPVATRIADFESHCRATIDEWTACCDFLKQCKPIRNIIGSRGSYYWKHRCEDWAGAYITSGMLIAAAIHLGIPYRQAPHKAMNALFALSTKTENLPLPIDSSNEKYRELCETLAVT